MTRLLISHNYHGTKSLSHETFCSRSGESTPHVCEWCGGCSPCHKGASVEKRY